MTFSSKVWTVVQQAPRRCLLLPGQPHKGTRQACEWTSWQMVRSVGSPRISAQKILRTYRIEFVLVPDVFSADEPYVKTPSCKVLSTAHSLEKLTREDLHAVNRKASGLYTCTSIYLLALVPVEQDEYSSTMHDLQTPRVLSTSIATAGGYTSGQPGYIRGPGLQHRSLQGSPESIMRGHRRLPGRRGPVAGQQPDAHWYSR